MLFTLSHIDNSYIEFVKADDKNLSERQIQGAQVYSATLKDATIQVQELNLANSSISYRFFDVISSGSFQFQETSQGIRIEAVLSGKIEFLKNSYQLLPGQFHFTNSSEYSLFFQGQTASSILITYLSQDLLDAYGLNDVLIKDAVFQLDPVMTEIVRSIFVHDYNDQLRNFFYENCIRELLLCQLKQVQPELPDQLNKTVIASILRADAIIKENLHVHHTINELAKLSGTNAFTLKKGFRQYFKMGLFERLSSQRLLMAKEQLKDPDSRILDISIAAGYQHVASFIKAFKKKFGITPLEWKKSENRP